MNYVDSGIACASCIQDLSLAEIDQVNGGGDVFTTISIAMGAAATVAGGAASIPTPASPALASFAVFTGLISAGAAYLSSVGAGDPPRERNQNTKPR